MNRVIDPTVYIVEDDDAVRESLAALIETLGTRVRSFPNAETFLAALAEDAAGCVVTDVRMPGMDGLAILQDIGRRHMDLPVILITGNGDVPLAVRAMKAGALDFLEKPFDDEEILTRIQQALEEGRRSAEQNAFRREAERNLDLLTARERDVLELLVAGRKNKMIAHELGIAPRTVEVHRARVMDKMGATSLSHLVRAALAAGIEIDA